MDKLKKLDNSATTIISNIVFFFFLRNTFIYYFLKSCYQTLSFNFFFFGFFKSYLHGRFDILVKIVLVSPSLNFLFFLKSCLLACFVFFS